MPTAMIRLRSDGDLEITKTDLASLGSELAGLSGCDFEIDESPSRRFAGPDLPPGMTLEELIEIADDAGTVDLETYRRLFPGRYVPDGPPGFENDQLLVLYRLPRRTRQEPILAEIVALLIPWTSGYIATKVADAAIAWVRDRWRREKAERGHATKRIVTIYGPHDEVLRHVVIEEPDGRERDLRDEAEPS